MTPTFQHLNETSTASAKTSRLESTLQTRIITSLSELSEKLNLPGLTTPHHYETTRAFPIQIPESTLKRIEPCRYDDPILLQFAPAPLELVSAPGYSKDPLCEWASDRVCETPHTNSKAPSQCILQKYNGRALVITTNACAAKCRFCFRRHFPQNRALFPIPLKYREHNPTGLQTASANSYFDAVFAPIRADETISELILSGGDPLTLTDNELRALFHYIRTVKSVKRVRIHSRAPILTPGRISDEFPSAEEINRDGDGTPLVLHMSLHVNSPNEIDSQATTAILSLRRKGYVLTSQTVLLKGVNDRLETLQALYEKLINLGVVPYYLFQLDHVQGAAHWEVSDELGRKLIRQLSVYLPGYAVPRFAREFPNRPSKTNLMYLQ